MNEPENKSPSLTEQIRAAAGLLESIVGDPGLMAQVPEAERNRLLAAAGRVSLARAWAGLNAPRPVPSCLSGAGV